MQEGRDVSAADWAASSSAWALLPVAFCLWARPSSDSTQLSIWRTPSPEQAEVGYLLSIFSNAHLFSALYVHVCRPLFFSHRVCSLMSTLTAWTQMNWCALSVHWFLSWLHHQCFLCFVEFTCRMLIACCAFVTVFIVIVCLVCQSWVRMVFIFHTQLSDQCRRMMDRWILLIRVGNTAQRGLFGILFDAPGQPAISVVRECNQFRCVRWFILCVNLCCGVVGGRWWISSNYGSSCNHQRHRVFMSQLAVSWAVCMFYRRKIFFSTISAWRCDLY